jgi:hypothetical protein
MAGMRIWTRKRDHPQALPFKRESARRGVRPRFRKKGGGAPNLSDYAFHFLYKKGEIRIE